MLLSLSLTIVSISIVILGVIVKDRKTTQFKNPATYYQKVLKPEVHHD